MDRRLSNLCFLILVTVYTKSFSYWTQLLNETQLNKAGKWGNEYIQRSAEIKFMPYSDLVFVAIGDSLFMGTESGSHWKNISNGVKSNPNLNFLLPHPVLQVGEYSSDIYWNDRISIDSGKSWSHPITKNLIHPTAMCFSASGFAHILLASQEGYIFLSTDSGATFLKQIFNGSVYTPVTNFTKAFFGNLIIAQANSGSSQISFDAGVTWRLFNSLPQKRSNNVSQNSLNPPIQFYPEIFQTERFAYQEILWLINNNPDGTRQLYKIKPHYYSLGALLIEPSPNKNNGWPDSPITRLESAPDAIKYDDSPTWYPSPLYLGTWGQGVFVSNDRGLSWHSQNQGLTDLHIDALTVLNSGVAIAMTPVGLFRWVPETAAIHPRKLTPPQTIISTKNARYLINGKRQ